MYRSDLLYLAICSIKLDASILGDFSNFLGDADIEKVLLGIRTNH